MFMKRNNSNSELKVYKCFMRVVVELCKLLTQFLLLISFNLFLGLILNLDN